MRLNGLNVIISQKTGLLKRSVEGEGATLLLSRRWFWGHVVLICPNQPPRTRAERHLNTPPPRYAGVRPHGNGVHRLQVTRTIVSEK
jgi:hypothetical protein